MQRYGGASRSFNVFRRRKTCDNHCNLLIVNIRRGGRAVECTGLENRHPLTGIASSNLALSANRSLSSTKSRQRFWTPGGAPEGRGPKARVNLALSANRSLSSTKSRQRFWTPGGAPEGRGPKARVNLALSAN